MSSRYLIPASCHRVEDSIKRSRFIASIAHAPDIKKAKAFIVGIKAEFLDATHNCWAFNAGPPGDTAKIGMSDDGEPHGTAGKPMLGTLSHGDIGEIVVVVTRYFGGTKLGSGGLVRAYSGMVQMGLETLPTREQVETLAVTVSIPYAVITVFKRMLSDYEAEVRGKDFGTEAVFMLDMPVEHLPGFTSRLADLTDGRGIISQK